MTIFSRIGLSLNWGQFVENWRKLALEAWARLLLVTFILPPVFSGSHFQNGGQALPGIAAYAIAAPFVMAVVSKRE